MPRSRLDLRAVSSLFLLLFLGLSDNQTIAALLPALIHAFHVSVASAGMLVVVYSVLAAAAGFTAGTLSDHYGRRRFLLAAVAIFAAASFAASRTVTFPQLLAARALTGMAAGTLSTCSLAYAGDTFNYAVRGRALGLISVAYFAAPVVGVPLGAQIADRFGWRSAFLLFAILACVAACGTLLLPRDRMQSGSAPIDLKRSARTFQKFIARRDLAAGVGLAFLVSGGLVGFLTYVGEWMSAQFGLSTRGIGWVFMYAGLVAAAGAPAGGWLADRWDKRSVSIAGNVLLAASVVMIPSFPWGVALFAVFGATSLGAAFRQGPLSALMTEMVPDAERGSYMAARGVASQLGVGAAVLAGGALYDRWGYAAVTLLCGLMTVAAAALLAAWISEPMENHPSPSSTRR